MKAVCFACLEERADFAAAWLEQSVAGEPVELLEGPHDTEFRGVILEPPDGKRCPRCGSDEVLIAVTDEVAANVAHARRPYGR